MRVSHPVIYLHYFHKYITTLCFTNYIVILYYVCGERVLILLNNPHVLIIFIIKALVVSLFSNTRT